MSTAQHVPVLLHETIGELKIQPEAWYVDATFGRGGHTKAILDQGAKVVGLDWDSESIEYGTKNFKEAIEKNSLILIHASFANLRKEIQALTNSEKIAIPRGVLFDFGTSSDQLTSEDRGFSFQGDGPLDMRMDTRKQVRALDILAAASERELTEIFKMLGGEERARHIARAIKKSHEPITTTRQLSTLVERVKGGRRGHLHPATKIFQALRIVVNSELDEISEAVPQAYQLLQNGGSIVTIAFHEGEDRIVKSLFKQWEREDKGVCGQKKPIMPSEEELVQNPRARSARLRSFYVS